MGGIAELNGQIKHVNWKDFGEIATWKMKTFIRIKSFLPHLKIVK